MAKISVMIHTASHDSFLSNKGISSYFEDVVENLSNQSFKDFEFIYIDTWFEENKSHFEEFVKRFPFTVKHVPVHHQHRYWFDRGNTYISAAKNTGILYADGELCITFDDSEFFPSNLLELYWKHYLNGFYMLGIHNRLKEVKTLNGKLIYPISGEIYISDHRINEIKDQTLVHSHGVWAFAGTSFSIKDAISINGFNERMDGCKSLEDCDFGNRLKLLGRNFILDKNGIFFILDHQSYTDNEVQINWDKGADGQQYNVEKTQIKKKHIESFVAIENYGMYMCGVELNEIVANKSKINESHIRIIKRETLKYRGFDPWAPENMDKTNIWNNVPTFDLEAQRIELRNSNLWKWN
jgi:hypothetical protein